MNEVLNLQGMDVADFDAPDLAKDDTNPADTVMTSILTIVMQ